jgi:hypothetical protein
MRTIWPMTALNPTSASAAVNAGGSIAEDSNGAVCAGVFTRTEL